MNPNNTLTREQIQEKYIEWDLNQMTHDDLRQFFINTQQAELDALDDIELVKEVKHYAPQLIENITLKVAWIKSKIFKIGYHNVPFNGFY